MGSPPLVRERRHKKLTGRIHYGITPARAGKTMPWHTCAIVVRDHPRSCGKDTRQSFFLFRRPGSPPLVRERPTGLHNTSAVPRITPARAGKTRRIRLILISNGDHPRSCGKDRLTMCLGCHKVGSPPLVRERQPRKPV